MSGDPNLKATTSYVADEYSAEASLSIKLTKTDGVVTAFFFFDRRNLTNKSQGREYVMSPIDPLSLR